MFPLKQKIAEEVSRLMEERVLAYFGPPKIFHSDNGREFIYQLIRAMFDRWGGDVHDICEWRPRHSQSQGLVERGNQLWNARFQLWKRMKEWQMANIHVEKQTNSHDCAMAFMLLHLQRHWCMDKILLNYHTMNYESTLQVVLMLRALHLFLLQWYTDNHRYSTKSVFLFIANADPQTMENWRYNVSNAKACFITLVLIPIQ